MEERLGLRLPPELARRVREIARAERRSVNAQLETWVEAAVRRWEAQQGQAEPPRPAGA